MISPIRSTVGVAVASGIGRRVGTAGARVAGGTGVKVGEGVRVGEGERRGASEEEGVAGLDDGVGASSDERACCPHPTATRMRIQTIGRTNPIIVFQYQVYGQRTTGAKWSRISVGVAKPPNTPYTDARRKGGRRDCGYLPGSYSHLCLARVRGVLLLSTNGLWKGPRNTLPRIEAIPPIHYHGD